MSAEVSFTKRAAAELSRCFNGLTVRGGKGGAGPGAGVGGPVAGTGSGGVGGAGPGPPIRKRGGERAFRIREFWAKCTRPVCQRELWSDPVFLQHLFSYMGPGERPHLARVCRAWKEALYTMRFWRQLVPIVRCRDIVSTPLNRTALYSSLERRGFESLCLFGACDDDVSHLIANATPEFLRQIRQMCLRCSSVTDKGLESLMESLPGIRHLELAGCNELTDAGLWASLGPRVLCLSLSDCINVADESVAAIAQLLPSLYELNLQAYHVTDASLAFFGPRQSASLCVLRLRSCWELTNQGLLNLVHALPHLTVLSLSGCSKVSDDGVELIAENLKSLRSLDLSWCPRITDAALEYVACDLAHLEELTLDRCVHITDIGLGYLSTMVNLSALYLRWCSQVRDFGLQHLCSMRSLQILSLAGCPLLTCSGLSSLIQLRHLRELELTNCPGTSRELYEYLRENIPNCLIVE